MVTGIVIIGAQCNGIPGKLMLRNTKENKHSDINNEQGNTLQMYKREYTNDGQENNP